MRSEIDTISGLVGAQRRRNQSSLMSKKMERMSSTQRKVEGDASEMPVLPVPGTNNDKNRTVNEG